MTTMVRIAFFEVDLECPKELHDKLNDYPLAPELTYVQAKSLSPYQVEQYQKHINHYLKCQSMNHAHQIQEMRNPPP